MLLLLLLLLLLPGLSFAQTPPWIQHPPGSNLITGNPNFNTSSGWSFNPGAAYDATQSKTADGTGSIKFTGTGGGVFLNPRINVTAGHTYMFSAYIKASQWPPGGMGLFFNLYDAGGVSAGSGEASRGSTGSANAWEEISIPILPSQTGSISIALQRLYQEPASGAGFIWVDEVYVGEPLGFGSAPSARIPFDGVNLKVDQLGNIQVRRDGGAFEDFFPFCIYGDANRPNYHQYYSNLGFNCDGWSRGNAALQSAKAAISSFNPKGIMTAPDISWVVYDCNVDGCSWFPDHHTLLDLINEHKNSTASDRQLWWYFDNEGNEIAHYDQVVASLDYLKANDQVGGVRRNPVLLLQGNWNMTRAYRTAGGALYSDIAGTYSSAANSGGAGAEGGIDVLENQQNQVLPFVVTNANIVTPGVAPGGLRAGVYKMIGKGARAWTMWRDCYNRPGGCDGGAAYGVETTQWVNDIGNIRRELDALIPLIKQPHWTTWTVSHNGGPNVDVGTRDSAPAAGARGHLIIVNNNASSKTVTFTITGLGYGMTSIKDYFTGAVRATPSGGTFTLTLPPVRIPPGGSALGDNGGSLVVRLDGTGTGDAFPTVSITPPPATTTNASIALSGSATDDIGVASIGVSCSPSCGSPAVSCTPSCSPTTTSVNPWNVTVPLTMGTNTITVTATDSTGKTTNGQVTVSRVLACQELVRWRFDETSGTTAPDTGTSSSTGTLVNAPTWVLAPNSRVGAAALNFVGANQQYVRNNTLAWPAGQPLTVELWVKMPSNPPQPGAWDIGGTLSTADNRLGCHIPWQDNIVYCDFGADTVVGRPPGVDFSLYLNTWTHVAYVADTTRRAIYLNGEKKSETFTPAQPLPALTGLNVGRYDFHSLAVTYYDTGTLDDFRLFTCVRSEAEILADYTGTSTSPPTLNVTTGSGSTVITTVQVTGTATDDVGVTSITMACSPACGSPAVTCTPACGATATTVSWTANVPLQLGPNVVTVTANDATPSSVNQQVTITLQLAATITNQAPPLGRVP